jgi:hypothetical protein
VCFVLIKRAPWVVLVLVVALGACSSGAASIVSGFPANPTHPAQQEITFHGCPPQGDGGDAILNKGKNRVDDGDNGRYFDVSLQTLLALPWPQSVGKQPRDSWSSTDAAAVAQYEGVPVRTTGYVLKAVHEGTESPNCHATDYRDFHVWLAVNAGDDRSKAMVIEVAPRVREQRSGWTISALEGLAGQQVRISGWLLLDQEHPEQIGQTRETLWEIHPIMHIEVNQNGNWLSIDS